MTERAYEGDQSSSSWDIPGPSSLAAIMDTVYTSSASDNPPRSEEMECDALFAESDDEVEVLPIPSEAIVTDRCEPVSKPLSSNYVNSTTPMQAYDLNIASIAPPVSSHTPVPEEYQPLPDSSSSLDYLVRNNLDSTNVNGQRFPDVNIRYQPKPVPMNQRGYYYPNYPHYAAGVRPAHDYVYTPYNSNNVIVVSDDRNYGQQPVSYTMPRNQTQEQNSATPRNYDTLQTQTGSRTFASNNHHVDNNSLRPIDLERPSRKLNISPRRRQSKENQHNINLIEVSSEEEDNVSTPKKTCDNGAGHQATTSNAEIPVNANSTAPRVEIKKERQNSEVATQAGDTSNGGGANVQHFCERRTSNHNHRLEHHINPNNVQVKQERHSCACSNRTGCSCVAHNIVCHSHVVPNEHHRHEPNNCNHQSGSHHHHRHHHHHHEAYRQCTPQVGAGTSNASLMQVKEEPGSQSSSTSNIKQETDTLAQTEDVGMPTTIKVEPSDQASVKVELGISSEPANALNVTVKSEADDSRRCCDVNAGGDRRVKESSPQPGTSSGRTAQIDARPTYNCDQEVQTNESSASAAVLSAPDLQLDWVSDSSSDDDVQVLGDDSNVSNHL